MSTGEDKIRNMEGTIQRTEHAIPIHMHSTNSVMTSTCLVSAPQQISAGE